jgi:hypothetical protein
MSTELKNKKKMMKIKQDVLMLNKIYWLERFSVVLTNK